MNKVFQFAIIASLIAFLIVSPESALKAMVVAGNSAVDLSFKLLAVYAIWLGILNVIEAAGLSRILARALKPLIYFLFGNEISKEAREFISLNMTANLLGLGGAATPSAIKAIESMNEGKSEASYPMIMLLVINAGGFSLIPTTIIGMRAAFDSSASSDIIPICLIALFCSTLMGVLIVKTLSFLSKKRVNFGRKSVKNGRKSVKNGTKNAYFGTKSP